MTAPGDQLTVSDSSAVFADKNVGTGKTITVSGISLSGTDAGNYTLGDTSTTAAANITPRTLTVSATGGGKTYDGGTTAGPIMLLDNRVSADQLTLGFASAAFADKHAGVGKTVTISGINISGGADAGNYTLAATTASTTATIAPLLLSVLATGVNKVYDGTTAATVTLMYSPVPGDQVTAGYASAAFADKNVGTGKTVTVTGISLSGPDAASYTLGSTTASTMANITPRTLTVSATGVNKVYDGGTTATVTLTDNRIAGDTLTDSDTSAIFADKNVGAGKTVSVTGISISGPDAGNYTANTAASTTANITAKTLIVSVTGGDKTYDSTPTAGPITLSDDRVAGDQLTDSDTAAMFADRNAGVGKTVTVTGISISGADAGNYTLASTTATAAATVTPRTLTIGVTSVNKVYDGTTAATVSFTDDRLSGDQLSEIAMAAFADKNVGTGKTVSVTGISLSGPDAGNYTLASTTASTTADITPRTLTVSAAAVNKVYDGGTTATVTLTDNRIAGDQLTDSDTSATFADKNVGAGKTVTVTGISISGADAGNYTPANTTATAAADITPRTLIVSVTGGDKTYDGTAAAGPITLSDNRIAGDQLTDSDTGAAFADKNAGIGKTMTVTGISISGADAGNYTLASTSATTAATVTPRTLTVGVTGVNKVYDGTSAANVTFSDDRLSGDQLSENATATFADKNVGTGKTVSVTGISLSGPDAGNYTLASTTASTTAGITPRTLTISATGVNKVYDGTTAATVSLSDNRVPGDQLTISDTGAAFVDPNVGMAKTINVNGIAISGADAGNYSLAGTTTTAAANITPAATATAIASAAPITAGGAGVVIVTVTSAAGIPTGSVALTVANGTPIVQPLIGGSATFDLGTLSAGAYSLSASYAAQGNFAASGPAAGSLHISPPITLSPSAPPPTVQPLPADTLAIAYNQVITAADGTGTVTLTATVQTAVPGLIVQPSGIGTLAVTGTPTAAGTESFTVTATDQGGGTTTSSYSIAVNSAVSLPGATGLLGTVNVPYNQSVSGSGGSGGDTYAVTAGTLPFGLHLDPASGAITGMPTTAGTYQFTVTATDKLGGAGNQSYVATINPAQWTAGHKGYSQTVAGGAVGDTFALAPKNVLPTGLKLNGVTGAITGTPSKAGTYHFTVIATSSVGATTVAVKLPYAIVIDPALKFATTKLAAWTAGATGYDQTLALAANAGTGAVTFAVTSAKGLPAGLTLDPTSGTITGTPTVAGTFHFTITATDGVGATAAHAFTITINKLITLSPTDLPNGSASPAKSYHQTILVKGGTPAVGKGVPRFNFAVTAGSLPPGLSLNAATGAITGTPTSPGSFSFTITVTDAVGATGSAGYTITV